MATDEKINCTKLPNEQFRVRSIFFEPVQANATEIYKKMMQQIVTEMPDTSLEYEEHSAENFYVYDSIDKLKKKNLAQINVLFYDSHFLDKLADFCYLYNNTFHNCPNILLCPLSSSEAESLVVRYPSFDLCVYNDDYEVLAKLFITIRNRTYDDQPIDLTVFNSLTCKQHITKTTSNK